MNEFDIIAEIFAPLANFPGAFGLKDDAAAIPPRPGFDLIVTTDAIAESTDFFKHDPPATIAQKALRVNLSDLAAKGAVPQYYLPEFVPAGRHDAARMAGRPLPPVWRATRNRLSEFRCWAATPAAPKVR